MILSSQFEEDPLGVANLGSNLGWHRDHMDGDALINAINLTLEAMGFAHLLTRLVAPIRFFQRLFVEGHLFFG